MKKRRYYVPVIVTIEQGKKRKKYKRATFANGDLMSGYSSRERAAKVYQNWLLAPFFNGINEIRELKALSAEESEVERKRIWGYELLF